MKEVGEWEGERGNGKEKGRRKKCERATRGRMKFWGRHQKI
ncbi:MAG: hypothetical protein QW199_02715 [Candidatus Pacearchaeota archaeon]